MAAEREVHVKLVADTAAFAKAMKRAAKRVRKLTAAMHELNDVAIKIRVDRADAPTRQFDVARRGSESESVSVRCGQHHGLPDSESTVDQWEVDPMPTTDFAARALREAQEQRAHAYPNEPASDLIWHLRKRGADD